MCPEYKGDNNLFEYLQCIEMALLGHFTIGLHDNSDDITHLYDFFYQLQKLKVKVKMTYLLPHFIFSFVFR